MKVYRLINRKFGSELSGEGARLAGGRWNSPNIPVIYTSDSRALCSAEVAVNLPMGLLPIGYEMITIEIPDDLKILEILTGDLPSGWRKYPYMDQTIRMGDEFISRKEYAVLKVPSAVIPGDFNYLINPRHPGFGKIYVITQEPYEFDERFFNR